MIDWRLGVYENAAVAAADDDELLLKRPLLIKVRSSCFFYVSDLFPLFPPLALDLSPLNIQAKRRSVIMQSIGLLV